MQMQIDREALASTIKAAYEDNGLQSTAQVRKAIDRTIGALDNGWLRCAEPVDGRWVVHDWVKQAIELYFATHNAEPSEAGPMRFYDKVPLKSMWENRTSIRIVPPACVRFGAYLAANTVLMPCFINIGAYVGEGTMVDTWATVGSCAQIGTGVHLSGGVGIGGVLEPLQANPTIIEDNCFIGARSEVVEGVIVEENSVLGMGVFIGQSTKIVDRTTGEVFMGKVPPYSVVVPGTLPSSDGRYGLHCAVIVKRVDAQTRAKTSINELLRSAESP